MLRLCVRRKFARLHSLVSGRAIQSMAYAMLLLPLPMDLLAQAAPGQVIPQTSTTPTTSVPAAPKPPSAPKTLDQVAEDEERKLANPLNLPKELQDLQDQTKADDPFGLNKSSEEDDDAALDERLRAEPDFNSGSNYDGPDFLRKSRSKVGRRERGFSPFSWAGSLSGTYDSLFSGFQAASAAAASNTTGNAVPTNNFVLGASYGVQAGFSASGQKRMRRSVLGVDYSGNYAKFTNRTQFDGTSQFLSISYDRKINRRWDASLISNAGSTNRVYSNSVLSRYNVADIGSVPIQELFDSRISFANQQATIGYVITPRILLSFQGEAGVIRRKTRSLADLNLYSGGASLMYRIDRGTSIGLDYQYQTFNYGRQFGETDINMLRAGVAKRINAMWQTQFALIGFRQQTIGIEVVTLSPEIQALLGRIQNIRVYDTDSYNYGLMVQLDRHGRSSLLSFRGERTIRPGNGLFNTSLYETAGFTLSSKNIRLVRLSGGGSYDNFKPIGSTLSNFQSIGANVELSRTIRQRLSWIARVETRRIRVANSGTSRHGSQVTIGVSYGSQPGANVSASPQGGLSGGIR